jgi:hypothetical protein
MAQHPNFAMDLRILGGLRYLDSLYAALLNAKAGEKVGRRWAEGDQKVARRWPEGGQEVARRWPEGGQKVVDCTVCRTPLRVYTTYVVAHPEACR